MKTFWTFVGVVVDAVALILAVALLLSGHWLEAAGLGVVVLAGLAVAAWSTRGRPEPAPAEPGAWLVVDEALPPELSATEEQMLRFGVVADPVDVHQAQMARVLNGPVSTFGMARYDDSAPTFVWFPDSLGGK